MASDRSSGLTMRATCLLAAGFTALICGAVLGEADLTRAGLLALLVPLAAYLVVHRARFQIANRRSLEPERATAGESVVVHLALRNNSRLPVGTLMLEDSLPGQVNGRARFVLDGLVGREERTVSYRIPALARGKYRSGPLRVRLTDPFRLIDLMRAFTPTSELLVGPVIEHLPGSSGPRSHDVGDNAGSHSVGTHGADDASTREYRTGDDLRKIHWKSTARTGSLMVRQEERPWQGRGTILLDLRSVAHARDAHAGKDPRNRDSLEWAISAAASIASHLIAHRQPVQLVYDTTAPSAVPITGPTELRDLLATVEGSRDRQLSGLGAPLGRAARDSTVFAVLGTPEHAVSGGHPDSSTVRMLLDVHAGRPSGGLAFVLDSPTWAGHAPGGPDGPAAGTARALQAAGWRAIVVTADDDLPAVWARLVTGRTTRAASAAGVART